MARTVTREYLEYQADRIEMVLAAHHVPARVSGGAVLPRWLRFDIDAGPEMRVSKVRGLSEELALALGSAAVRVGREGNQLTVAVARKEGEPVDLLGLMEDLPRRMAATAVLGVSETGQPLLIRLSSPDVAHVLVAGTTGSGKTELLRTMLVSLALVNRQREVQMVLIDPKGRGLRPLAGLPHLLMPPITDLSDAVDVLQRLVLEMERRDREGVDTPRLVIAIDEVVDLVMQGGEAVTGALTRIAQRGREAGLHLIVGAQKPSSAMLGGQLKANFPVRLVGRVGSAQDALAAAGVGGTGAEQLLGRGDFLVVAAGEVTRFQAAYIDPAGLSQVAAALRDGGPVFADEDGE